MSMVVNGSSYYPDKQVAEATVTRTDAEHTANPSVMKFTFPDVIILGTLITCCITKSSYYVMGAYDKNANSTQRGIFKDELSGDFIAGVTYSVSGKELTVDVGSYHDIKAGTYKAVIAYSEN